MPLYKNKKRFRIFKGAVLSLALCAVVFTLLAPFASAATYTEYYCEVLATINVRSGPGLDYPIVTQYSRGQTFLCTVEEYTDADGYRWYACPDGYIAQTGGLRFYSNTVVSDFISAISPYGQISWEHSCSGNGLADWGYELSVFEGGYWFNCDCGVTKCVRYERRQLHDGDGNLISDIYFQGLDTDNDERIDLYPGQTKKLKNRGNSELRPYTILEFFDQAIIDIPTVTLVFVDKDYNELQRYTFNFDVKLFVYDYGIEMYDNDGMVYLYEFEADSDLIVTDLFTGVMVKDVQYKVNFNMVDLAGNILEPHPEYYLMIAAPGEGPNGPLENVVDDLTDFFGSADDFFSDFGGLNDVFTDEDSPFNSFDDGLGSGVSSVFYCVRNFISALPVEITTPILVVFILSVAIGVLKLFL